MLVLAEHKEALARSSSAGSSTGDGSGTLGGVRQFGGGSSGGDSINVFSFEEKLSLDWKYSTKGGASADVGTRSSNGNRFNTDGRSTEGTEV